MSVPALRNFLADLLDRMGASAPDDVVNGPMPDYEQRAPANPRAAAAMQAYQAGAVRGTPAQQHAHPDYERPVEQPVTAEPRSALDQAAAGLDRATLLDLIRELDRLTAIGVTSIALEKGDGFLGSIRAGIDRALANT